MRASDYIDLADIHLQEVDLSYSPGHLQVRMLLRQVADKPDLLAWVSGVLESYNRHPPARTCELHAGAHGTPYCRNQIECADCALFPTSRWACTVCVDRMQVEVSHPGFWSEGRCSFCLYPSSYLLPTRRR